ncbi:MAG: hypothetical protein DWQ34_10905 [Planctomycetota bacterium]|nr:MAG: hypothetical protein DWQ29_19210 [Planctomycetota bacterium]REJ93437.1 MAG: hypothetical protein DWQ34_10905 [Planctomycetota bacterium]REK25422.1 MAG: hypothetical protein DWQ41_12050 [Planctomycetota bacterium]REK38162.1 MAG: hypothetical protein DWQ45_05125 [Planctomycetota bacterium]
MTNNSPSNVSSRREFLQAGFAGAAALALGGASHAFQDDHYPPTRVITRGPRHHWFGYYDKLQFDPTSRFVLGMEVPFEHRSPTADDVIRIGMVDLEDDDRWIELGESSSWNWQQGCMLQWLPGSANTILWNDREGDRYVCRILNVETGDGRTVPHPIYSVSPDGKTAVTPDFSRIAAVRPGYGYAGLTDPYADDLAPDESGVWRVDLESGRAELIISLAQIAETGEIPNNQPDVKHYFNHLLFSPDGSRFIMLHRWRYPNGRRLTRLITANPDGSDIRVVIPNGYASHFIWRDPRHILSQSKDWLGNPEWGNFLFSDSEAGIIEEVGHGVLNGSGHLSYLPGNEWILNDTYPQGPERVQTPHLYHVESGRRIDLGRFPSPPEYTGEWRVDTHPRFSPDARYVCIDSPYQDEGRQLHLIEIGDLIG